LENTSALYKKGAMLASQGRIDESIAVFTTVVQLSPYSCLGHYGLGKAYLHSEGKLDLAVYHLRKSVDLDKSFVKGHFYLGMAYYLREDYIQAIHTFNTAYKLDYTWFESLYNIGAMYDIIDKNYEAMIYFKKYLNEKYRGQEEEGEIDFK